MSSQFETIAIIVIIAVQFIIALRVIVKIRQIKTFLPKGRHSLSLKNFSVQEDRIIKIEPTQVIEDESVIVTKSINNNGSSEMRPRDERGRFVSKKKVYSPIYGEMEVGDNED